MNKKTIICVIVGAIAYILTHSFIFTGTCAYAAYRLCSKSNSKVTRVAQLSLYDDGTGYAEILEEASAKNNYVWKFRWITFTPCYDCQTYGENLYMEPIYVKPEEICSITYEDWEKEKITEKRKQSLENDKSVFARYAAI